MNLQQQIKSSYIEAMKEKNTLKKNLFGVILGEIQNQELRDKSIDDIMVISILKKMEKSLIQTNTTESLQELELIKPYLPSLMSEDKIRQALNGLLENGVPKNMVELMKNFNLLYKVKADNKVVSEIIKSLI